MTFARSPRGALLFTPSTVPTFHEGRAITKAVEFTPDELAAGVPLLFGHRLLVVVHLLTEAPRSHPQPAELLGASEAIAEVRRAIASNRASRLPVLIQGPTGSGKELIAEALSSKPYVRLNAALLTGDPQGVFSYLFGHERGAYTGATSERVGAFQKAARGTLFFDELAAMPMEIQKALLRVFETNDYLPLGASEPRQNAARIIAATDSNLRQLVREGAFHAPLLHRLEKRTIFIPPLSSRRADIGPLLLKAVQAGLVERAEDPQLLNRGLDDVPFVTSADLGLLFSHSFPGNVRSLNNLVSNAFPRWRPGEQLRFDRAFEKEPLRAASAPSPPLSPTARRTVSQLSDEEIRAAVEAAGGNIAAAAEALSVKRSTLSERIKRMGR